MSNQQKAYWLGGTTVLFWSTMATVFKLALAEMSVTQLIFYATLTGALVLACYLLITRKIKALMPAFRQHWRLTLVAGMINPVAYYLVLLEAYDRLPAQVAQPINYTWAITLSIMSVIFLRQKLKITDIIATPICYLGVIVISLQGQWSLNGSADGVGILLVVFSTLLWASYWILNVRDPREPGVALCLNFMVALPITAVVCSLDQGFVPLSQRGLLAAIYVGCFEMGLAFILWSNALRLAENTSRVSNLIFLAPFISLVFIHHLLGETIYNTTYFGLALIIGGLLIQQIPVWRNQNNLETN